MTDHPDANKSTPSSSSTARRMGILIGLVVLAIVVVSPFVAIHFEQPGDQPQSNIAVCEANLRLLGTAVHAYAKQNAGQFPPGWRELMVAENLKADLFVCPVSPEAPAEAPTTRQAADLMADPHGHHCSYVYAGESLTDASATPADVIAFEPPGNHYGRVNLLFADGHVETLDASPVGPDATRLAHLQADAAGNVRPLRLRR